MPSNTTTRVTIYYGPLSWFKEQLGKKSWDSLLEIVYERDEASRHITHGIAGQDEPATEEPVPGPNCVAAESSDYASLQEHVITNFAGLIRSIDPKQLHLHNPPAHVHAQLARTFANTAVKKYEYPVVTRDTLIRFRDGFKEHLVGQEGVRESLLAALYPLTTGRRTKPVVLMFYGPSGVGKTETAQFVNGLLEGTLLRKQFSMFHSDKFASYLFGGTHSEASFAHDLLDRDSGVILIDEFDKANAVFHSAFYQVFDSGVFEDKNYTVELGPSLVICTSNYGSEDAVRQALGDALHSRFDGMVRFQPLSKEEMVEVINRIVDDRFTKLAPDEQERLDPDAIKSLLHQRAAKTGNVRRLGKLIDGVIALLLVQAVLDEQAALLDAPINRVHVSQETEPTQ
ncbi:AAA family ATPase [Promicromonospora iranensis]|uniref:ATP-dependent Clp protease ATP-binding subunit ClpA n=1 Tax=Promicromonospora iranensis TaxID=1105144 RepID=A0ABU2CK51_9MICO|nr:AAA family ATPase [Promicromonospora iranensis]MDR7381724.1 ATP-dependent Clp protease ATP-binding subunit ClpA [Promicromonospora iranensis]